jgi:hypothetical protein
MSISKLSKISGATDGACDDKGGVKKISSNVPVVYDVFAARIRACVARPGLQKCGGVLAWEWSVAE